MVVLPIACVLLSGCFFAGGVAVEPQAYVRVDANDPTKHVFSLLGEKWHTGNAHMPFDFTVYRYPRQYEVRAAAQQGTMTVEQFEVFLCGRKIESVVGTLMLTPETFSLHIQYPLDARAKVLEKVDVKAKISSALPPLNPCPNTAASAVR